MKMETVVKALEFARDNYIYGYVEVTIPGQNATEMIINESESLDNKIAYYKKAYDENGVHCMNDRIKIVSAGAIKRLETMVHF